MASLQNSGAYVPSGASTSHSFNVTVSAGTNRRLMAGHGREGTLSISALTFDGTDFLANLRASVQNATDVNLNLALYDYPIPDNVGAGTYPVAFTTSLSTSDVTMMWEQWEGVAAGAPESTNTQQWTTTATNATATVTATDGAALFGFAITGAGSQTWTVSGTVAERLEQNETNYTTVFADAVSSGGGSRTMTATVSSGGTGNKCLLLASYASAPLGPTITVQPVADVGIISNGQSTVYTATATGTNVQAPTWSEDGSSIADGGIYDIVNVGAGTSSCTSTLTITRTVKTGTPFDIKAAFTDDNGNTDTNTVTDTWWTGPVVTVFPPTDVNGEATAQVTSDFITADNPGTALEVRIPLADGDVAITLTTTAT